MQAYVAGFAEGIITNNLIKQKIENSKSGFYTLINVTDNF